MMHFKLGKINTLSIDLAKQLNLQSLVDGRFNNDIIFLYTFFNNIIVCPELLEKNPLNVPNLSLRSTNTFYVQPKSQDFSHYAAMNRIIINDISIKN